MRRFFSFKSSGSIGTNCHENSMPPASPSSGDMACLKKLQDDHSKFSTCEKVQDLAQTLQDTSIDPQKQYPESEDSSRLLHKRSRLLSCCAMNSGSGEENIIPFGDAGRATSSHGYLPYDASNRQRDFHALIPEKCTRSKSSNLFPSHPYAAENYGGSPSSLKNPEIISGNSPCNSPAQLRCTAAHASWYRKSNELLDRYIDGEEQEVNPEIETRSDECLSEPGMVCPSAEMKRYPSAGPLQVQSTAVSSLARTTENVTTYSSKGEEGNLHHISGKTWTRYDRGTVHSLKQHNKTIKELPHAFLGKLTMNFQDRGSESSTTFEDIYMDSFESQPSSHSQHCSTDDSPSYKKQNSCFTQDTGGLEKYEYYLENGSLSSKNGKNASCDPQDTDEQIIQKLNEVEKMIDLISNEDPDTIILQCRNLDISSLIQTIRNMKEEKKNLLLGVSSQLQGRLTDRSAAKKHIRQARREMNIRTRRLEREKNDLQFSLEKELDKQSNDWSVKFENIQLEEERLRVRVRELAEQNVSLQRENFSLKSSEGDSRKRIVNSEMEIANLTAILEQTRADNCKLHNALSEMEECFNTTEKDWNRIRKCLREQEKEHRELQKLVANLQRLSNEQQMTINGLRVEYTEQIDNKSTDRNDQLIRLQMEQLRLTGIEQNIRKELETCKHELQTLRHENIGLLNRLQATGNSHGFSSMRLDHELHTRVDCLQTQGLSLLDDIQHFNGDLLGWLEHKQFDNELEAEKETNKYLLVDYTMKRQSLSRRSENFRRSLQTIAKVLDDKSHSEAVGCQSQPEEDGMLKQSEDNLEIQLKAETILTRLLREKLYSNELELERLQADLASSIRVHDVMQTEILRMQDEVSYLTHKTTDLEIQTLQKDESIRQLDSKCQECTKEFTAAQSILRKVTEERNHMWEEVKNSRERIMFLDYEVLSLKKKIEELDENILTKEGQISILKDSLEKPFDLILSLDQ